MNAHAAANSNCTAATSVAAVGTFAVAMVAANAAVMAPVSRKRGYYASVRTRS